MRKETNKKKSLITENLEVIALSYQETDSGELKSCILTFVVDLQPNSERGVIKSSSSIYDLETDRESLDSQFYFAGIEVIHAQVFERRVVDKLKNLKFPALLELRIFQPGKRLKYITRCEWLASGSLIFQKDGQYKFYYDN